LVVSFPAIIELVTHAFTERHRIVSGGARKSGSEGGGRRLVTIEWRADMATFIFLCDLSTEQECLDRNLFGTNPGEQHQHHYSKVAVDDTLFLYNIETGTLRGPYTATIPCKINIEPTAWKKTKRKFPWQVRVDDTKTFSLPIGINDIRIIIPMAPTSAGVLPPSELSDDQTAKIIELMRVRNLDKSQASIGM
jgi:hypothetical protein